MFKEIRFSSPFDNRSGIVLSVVIHFLTEKSNMISITVIKSQENKRTFEIPKNTGIKNPTMNNMVITPIP